MVLLCITQFHKVHVSVVECCMPACGFFWRPILVIFVKTRILLLSQDFDVREYAISLAGRLSEKNPAYVLPALRRHLIQLLTYLKQR